MNNNDEKVCIDLVPMERIKRIPCLMFCAPSKTVEKHRAFASERGCRLPVFVSDSGGCMTLLSGSASFEAGLEDKAAAIPAVIVKTGGDADELMFALQSAELDASPGAVAVSDAIVRLVDVHHVPRKSIAGTLGKSPAWIARMESMSRRLTESVKEMVADGQIKPRTAHEIARLPKDVQTAFAVSAGNEFLSKENVAYLVNRYLDEDTGDEERARIVSAPGLALPSGAKGRGKAHRDTSVSASLSHAVAMCLDSAAFLMRILGRSDIGEAAVRLPDILALDSSLDLLRGRLKEVFPRGKTPMPESHGDTPNEGVTR